MLKLKRLKIEKYRSVKPGTELHFRDSLNVLLGRNGTGKTTLLNLLVQLLNWDFSQLQEEAVELEYDLEINGGKLRVRVCSSLIQEVPSLLPEPLRSTGDVRTLGLMPAGSRYSALLEVSTLERGKAREVLKIEGTKLSIEDGHGHPAHQINMSRALIGKFTQVAIMVECLQRRSELGDAAVMWIARMGRFGITPLRRFDESLGYLDYIVQEVRFDAQKVADSEDMYQIVGSTGSIQALIQGVEDALALNSDVDSFKLESGKKGAGFLDRFVGLLEGRSAQIRIQRTSRTSGPSERIVFGNIRFEFIRRDGSLVNHTLLSYGQKRLLAFCYYLAANTAIVVADELVNGMHHEWIDACLEDLGRRQAFLTSQNPLLLDYLAFESIEEVQESFVLCRTDLHESREQWIWENMTDADAEGLFKAYQVAIQHVSELLRTRGLW